MGSGRVTEVIDTLKTGGFRAAAAWPGEKIPQLGDVAVTVCLKKQESDGTTVVQATVWSPFAMGGSTCEGAACQVAALLADAGAECTVDKCRYDSNACLFYMPVEAAFAGEAEQAGFHVTMGAAALDYAVSFRSQQATEDPVEVPVTGTQWTFRLEEWFPVGAVEQNAPAEPFTVTVKRKNVTETYRECRITSVSREDEETGLRQIRTGTAASRGYMGIL